MTQSGVKGAASASLNSTHWKINNFHPFAVDHCAICHEKDDIPTVSHTQSGILHSFHLTCIEEAYFNAHTKCAICSTQVSDDLFGIFFKIARFAKTLIQSLQLTTALSLSNSFFILGKKFVVDFRDYSHASLHMIPFSFAISLLIFANPQTLPKTSLFAVFCFTSYVASTVALMDSSSISLGDYHLTGTTIGVLLSAMTYAVSFILSEDLTPQILISFLALVHLVKETDWDSIGHWWMHGRDDIDFIDFFNRLIIITVCNAIMIFDQFNIALTSLFLLTFTSHYKTDGFFPALDNLFMLMSEITLTILGYTLATRSFKKVNDLISTYLTPFTDKMFEWDTKWVIWRNQRA